MELTNLIKINLKNIPGRRVKKKLVVIESDDWGGIRMPSRDVCNKLIDAKIPIVGNFDLYDTLADKKDLDLLFEVLMSVRDTNGHHAVMTPITNVANPDFKRIKDSDFTQYFYESFPETLKRYGRDPETFSTWMKGIELGIFIPELHGREHISVQFWMQKLRDGDKRLRTAFEHEYVNVQMSDLNPVVSSFRPELYFDNPNQIEYLKTSITEGAGLFKDIFGYVPRAFAPTNSIFHPVFEQTVAETGIKYLNVNQFNPVPDKNGNLRSKYYPVGSKSIHGITYYTRNCSFEPIIPNYKGVDATIRQMEAAFRWRKPAVICTHRANYIGTIDEKNRERGLRELKLLLDTIVRKWPDVVFMSSADMLRAVHSND